MAKDYYIEFDTSEVEKYSIQLENAKLNFNDFVTSYLNELANKIMQKAINRTPVAQVNGGTLRRSYKVTKVEEKGDKLELTVYNDARQNGMDESYASYVEEGHYTRNKDESQRYWIEGYWMLTTSTDEVKADMQKIWDKKINEWARYNKL